MLPIKIDDPPESLVDKTAISNEISWKKGWKTGSVPDIISISISPIAIQFHFQLSLEKLRNISKQ